MENDFQISLVIPTRDRSEYLASSLKTALEVDDPNIEVIVSDNASEDNTREVVSSFKDSRLKYVNTGRRVSMRQNFEFAMQHVTGDYVSYIGDDDAFLPLQMKFLRHIIAAYQPEAMSWPKLNYWWPIAGMPKKSGYVRLRSGELFGECKKIDAKKVRSHFLDEAYSFIYSDCDELRKTPRIYHGCVSTKLMENIKRRFGFYFASRTPDIFVEYASLFLTDNIYHIGHPLTINGASPASNGVASGNLGAKHFGPAASIQFQKEAEIDETDEPLPYMRPVTPTLYATFELVRKQLGINLSKEQSLRWHTFVIEQTQKSNPELVDDVLHHIRNYAQQLGIGREFEGRLCRSDIAKDTTASVKRPGWDRQIKKYLNAKLSAKISIPSQETNTVANMAQNIDFILGTDFKHILNGKMSKQIVLARLLHRFLLQAVSR